MEMKRLLAAGIVAFAGLMTAGLGISNADTIQTEGNYQTRQACQDAGPGVTVQTNFGNVPPKVTPGILVAMTSIVNALLDRSARGGIARNRS